MMNLGHEAVPFEDILTQMSGATVCMCVFPGSYERVIDFQFLTGPYSDCIKPKKEGDFKLSDFLDKVFFVLHVSELLKLPFIQSRVKVCGVFFNLLVNLNKFIAYEQRDPFSIKQMQAEPRTSFTTMQIRNPHFVYLCTHISSLQQI